MSIEIGSQIPSHFKPEWPEQFELFSFLEFACGIPQLLFVVTTYKENGFSNVCPQTWSSFVSGKNGCGYYAVLGGLMERTHTYRNILRERCFCIDFLPQSYYDSMMRAISQNEAETDEFDVCGFTKAECTTIHAPRIIESFLSLECELSDVAETAGGALKLVIGKTTHVTIQEAYAVGIDEKYSKNGFSLNIHSPINAITGICDPVGIAELSVARKLI